MQFKSPEFSNGKNEKPILREGTLSYSIFDNYKLISGNWFVKDIQKLREVDSKFGFSYLTKFLKAKRLEPGQLENVVGDVIKTIQVLELNIDPVARNVKLRSLDFKDLDLQESLTVIIFSPSIEIGNIIRDRALSALGKFCNSLFVEYDVSAPVNFEFFIEELKKMSPSENYRFSHLAEQLSMVPTGFKILIEINKLRITDVKYSIFVSRIVNVLSSSDSLIIDSFFGLNTSIINQPPVDKPERKFGGVNRVEPTPGSTLGYNDDPRFNKSRRKKI